MGVGVACGEPVCGVGVTDLAGIIVPAGEGLNGLNDGLAEGDPLKVGATVSRRLKKNTATTKTTKITIINNVFLIA